MAVFKNILILILLLNNLFYVFTINVNFIINDYININTFQEIFSTFINEIDVTTQFNYIYNGKINENEINIYLDVNETNFEDCSNSICFIPTPTITTRCNVNYIKNNVLYNGGYRSIFNIFSNFILEK